MNNIRIKSILRKVKREYANISCLSDEELKNKTVGFKERIEKGERLNSLLPEAFAVVCEVDRRMLGMMPFDVQIMGAIALHYCNLAEMNTGEGKTLTATMPLYLNALTGKGAMLVTANEYLANRDANEMRPVFEFLGLSVMCGAEEASRPLFTNKEKQEIYKADIVYTTHSAVGFDYLLNNLVTKANDRFYRLFDYVIIDEADMVLLDAAQMPLVISGSPRVQSNLYESCNFFVTTLQKDRDYEVKEESVWLTDSGVAYAEQFFGINGFYEKENFEINRHVTLALMAHALNKNEKDYLVTDNGELTLLDKGTGRVLRGMKLRGGMHQALEQKEQIKLTGETRSVASITYQNLFLMFPRMSGMSGTIADAREELWKIYHKSVSVIRPNMPMIRVDKQDKFFNTFEEQHDAAIEEVLRLHESKQPILVVTSSIKDTEYISRILVEKQIPHNVLNANSAYWEAQIIKEAGKIGNITVSTGMAGRGTDIKLQEGAAELGGLAVIGIGRMANVRLERQARGRSGRQGDPGSSQFFVSLQDETVTHAEKKRVEKIKRKNLTLGKFRLKHFINGAQKLGEENAVSIRKSFTDYDKIVMRQRNIIYDARNRLLDGEDVKPETIEKFIKQSIKDYVHSTKKLTNKDVNRYILNNISYSVDIIDAEQKGKGRLTKDLLECGQNAWKEKVESFPNQETLAEYIRQCVLRTIDSAWVEQIDYLQQLSFVVSGRATAQRNPLFEYDDEAYKSFNKMKKQIRNDVVRNVLLGRYSINYDGSMSVTLP